MNKNLLDYMFMCHKRADRSFFYKGKQFPICARCTGILVGYIIGIILLFIVKSTEFMFFSMLFFIPLLIDGGFQLLGKWESNNRRRFITGVLAGIATIFFVKSSIYCAKITAEFIKGF